MTAVSGWGFGSKWIGARTLRFTGANLITFFAFNNIDALYSVHSTSLCCFLKCFIINFFMVCKSNRDLYYLSITSVRKFGCFLQNSVSKQSVWFKTRWLTLSFDTGYFPKVISSIGNCPRVFCKWQHPKCAISQMASYQMWDSSSNLPKVRLSMLKRRRLQQVPCARARPEQA